MYISKCLLLCTIVLCFILCLTLCSVLVSLSDSFAVTSNQLLTSNSWVAKLSWLENAYSRPCYRPAMWSTKVSQGDLVYDVRSGFATGSVRERLQASVYSGRPTTFARLPLSRCVFQNLLRTF